MTGYRHVINVEPVGVNIFGDGSYHHIIIGCGPGFGVLHGEKVVIPHRFRDSVFFLWNAGMEEPVIVDKACCSVDVLPTLLNLFGFDYDSRMYAGRDIF